MCKAYLKCWPLASAWHSPPEMKRSVETPLKYYGTTRTFCKTWIKQLKKPCRSHSDYSMHQAICGSSAWVPSDLVRLTWDSFGLKVHMKLVHVRIPTRVKRTGSVTNLWAFFCFNVFWSDSFLLAHVRSSLPCAASKPTVPSIAAALPFSSSWTPLPFCSSSITRTRSRSWTKKSERNASPSVPYF